MAAFRGRFSQVGKVLSTLLGGAGRALGIPLFRRYWTGHSLASVGRWMYRTAIGWLAWEMTHSTSWLGAVAFADLVPTVLLTIFSGALADRFGFMRLIRLSQLMAGALAALLAILILTGVVGIFGLIVITACFGAAESLGQPARMSAVNAMVTRKELSSAIALGSASFNASRIVGPGIAGALILWLGAGAVIALCALTFFMFYALLRTIHIEEAKPAQHRGSSLLADIGSGISYVVHHRGIRFVMIMLAATSFFIRPVIELMPGVSGQIFDAGPGGLAFLLAAIGFGALFASLLLARRGEMQGLTKLLIFSTILSGISLMLSMQFGHIWIAAVFLAVMGAFMLCGNVAAQTLVQNSVAAPFRARVMSLFIIFAYGLPAVGAVLMGWIAHYAGLQATIGGGALVMLLFWLWSWPKRGDMAQQLEAGDPARQS